MLNYSLRQTIKILIAAVGLLMLPNIFAISNGDDEDNLGNILIYYESRGLWANPLMLFDPISRMSVPILSSPNLAQLQLSANGLLAFSGISDQHRGVYVMDIRRPLTPPLKITEQVSYPLAWSRDGRYLAFMTKTNNTNTAIHLWDGETVIDITPSDSSDSTGYYGVTTSGWSHDGRLAFTFFWGTERSIYIWDGHKTFDLREGVYSDNYAPTWDHTGRLAFTSVENGNEFRILVWDGVSPKNGLPDDSTFVEVAPEITDIHSKPVWSPDGHLSFRSTRRLLTSLQIYVWDGQTTINLTQNPGSHHGEPVWSADGRWALGEYSSASISITVRDMNNRTLFKTAGSSASWSVNGQLLICKHGASGMSLLMWDGRELFEITTSGSITAQWPGGEWMNCS